MTVPSAPNPAPAPPPNPAPAPRPTADPRSPLLGRPGRRAGPLAAVIVFGGGFGALELFWLFGSRPAGPPGLFAFPSATWGDGLLLPLQAFALAHLLDRLPERPPPGHPGPRRPTPLRHEPECPAREHPEPDRPARGHAETPRPGATTSTRRLPRLAALAGGLAGAAVVLGALLDPAPPVDWTLPRPHHFSPAGIWHGVFLVLASALFARLWVDLLDRLRRHVQHRQPDRPGSGVPRTDVRPDTSTRSGTRSRPGGSPTAPGAGWLSVAVCAAAGYAVLAAHDGSRAASTAADLSTLVALAVAAVVLFAAVGVALRRAIVPYLPALVRGLGVALALAAAVLSTAPRSPR